MTNYTKEKPHIAAVWQMWRFSVSQTIMWLIKVWFSASRFVVKIATFAIPPPLWASIKTMALPWEYNTNLKRLSVELPEK